MQGLLFLELCLLKMLFGAKGNEKLLISLLNAVLQRPDGEQIREIRLLPAELEREYHDLKGVALDLRAQDQMDRWLDVEIQVLETKEHVLLSEQLEIHLLEFPKYVKTAKEAENELEQWLTFLKEGKNMTQAQITEWGNS